jgi:hypothetical protein
MAVYFPEFLEYKHGLAGFIVHRVFNDHGTPPIRTIRHPVGNSFT